MAEPGSQFPGRAEELFAEFVARRDAGELVDLEELCRAHPRHAEELRRLHAELEELHRVLEEAAAQDSLESKLASEFGAEVDPGIDLERGAKSESASASSRLIQRLREGGPRGTRYRLLGEVARGGMGVILRAWDDDLRRTLAMKVVLGRAERSGETPSVDARTLGRFLEEAQITGQLDHPGIVPVHELGLGADGRVYFTMRLVRGVDLRRVYELVRERAEGWSQVRALGVLLRVCEAMAYAHEKGVVHRDLKPSNVMVGKFGEVYVMDWGLARVLDREDRHDLRLRPAGASMSSEVGTERRDDREGTPDSPLVTMDGDVVGTPSYMPPEQARGELERLGPHSDVYAIGAMLYQLLAGSMPYVPSGARVSQHTILAAVLQGPPAPIEQLAPQTPAELAAICERAMERDIARRYATTSALADDLRAYLEGRVVAAFETGTWAETKKWVVRNKPLAASLAAALLVLAAGLTTTLVFMARADARARELASANTTIEARNQELAETTRTAQHNEQQAKESERRALDAEMNALELKKRADESAKREEDLRREADERAHDAALRAREAQELQQRSDELADEAKQSAYYAAVVGAQMARRANEPANMRRLLDSAPKELRDWEWKYLDAVSDGSLVRLEGDDASWSPDGARIVTRAGKAACVWDARTGKELARMSGHSGVVLSAMFDAAGTRVVTTSADRTLRMWDAATGEALARPPPELLAACPIPLSLNGSHVMTTSRDYVVYLREATANAQLARAFVPKDNRRTSCFSPVDALYARSASNPSGGARETPTTGLVARLEGHTRSVLSVSFSADGSRVLTSSVDGTARIWDVRSGRQLVCMYGHPDAVYVAAFSPDGSRVVTGSRDSTARIWDAATGEELVRLAGHAASVLYVEFSPDGSLVVTGSEDGTARIWNAASGESHARLEGHTDVVNWAAFSADGVFVLTSSADGTTRTWDCARRSDAPGVEVTVSHEELYATGSLAFSLDGERVVVSPFDGSVRVYDVLTLTRLAQWNLASVRCASFSPDGSRLVVASSSAVRVRVLDATTGVELARLEGPDGHVHSAFFSRDGKRIVTASTDQSARVWDASSGAELARYAGKHGYVYSADFDPTGARAVVATASGAWVWDSETGKELLRLGSGPVHTLSAAFSCDGRQIVTANIDDTAALWDSSTGALIARLEGHTSIVRAAAFDSKGTRIVTASDDGTVRVWNAQSANELERFELHVGTVRSAAFSPDDSRIISMSSHGDLRMWDTVPYAARRRQILALREVEPAAERAVDEALTTAVDARAAGEQLRSAKLDPLVRIAASNALLRRTQAARDWVQALQEPLPLQSELEAVIRADTQQPAEVRALAGELARTLDDDPRDLNELAWRISAKPCTSDDAQRAVRCARRALELAPEDPDVLNTLGVALYRAGRFDECLATLRRSDELGRARRDSRQAADVAFLAMAHWKLGHAEEARAELAALVALASTGGNDETDAFVAEVRALIQPR